MDVGHSQQPDLLRDVVQFGFERDRSEIDTVGDADGLLPENLVVVGEGDDAVDLPGQAVAEQTVDLQLDLLFPAAFAEFRIVGIGRDFEGDVHFEPAHAAQPAHQQRIGIEVVADVEELHLFAADIVGDVGVGDAFEDLGAEPVAEGADYGVAGQASLRAVGADLHVAECDIDTAQAQGFALGKDFLADAAVGRESVEYDEQSFHGGFIFRAAGVLQALSGYTLRPTGCRRARRPAPRHFSRPVPPEGAFGPAATTSGRSA